MGAKPSVEYLSAVGAVPYRATRGRNGGQMQRALGLGVLCMLLVDKNAFQTDLSQLRSLQDWFHESIELQGQCLACLKWRRLAAWL